jgi:hypothetical protein
LAKHVWLVPIPVSERAKKVHALDRSATVTGNDLRHKMWSRSPKRVVARKDRLNVNCKVSNTRTRLGARLPSIRSALHSKSDLSLFGVDVPKLEENESVLLLLYRTICSRAQQGSRLYRSAEGAIRNEVHASVTLERVHHEWIRKLAEQTLSSKHRLKQVY